MAFDVTQSRTRTVPNPRRSAPLVHLVNVQQARGFRIDGSRGADLIVDAVVPTYYGVQHYEVYARIQGGITGDWVCLGKCRRFPMYVSHPIAQLIGETLDISVVLRSAFGPSQGPDGGTSTTITIARTGPTPADVTGFTAAPEAGGILFTWTPIDGTERPDVAGYEIRAGSTGWSSATLVGAIAPVNAPMLWVPRSQAPGTSFYIKAKTKTEIYSASPATATITSAQGDCLDNESMLGYQEVTVTAGASSATVTTVCPYDAAPYPVGGPSADVAFKPSFGTWSQNGDDTWSATMYIPYTSPSGGTLVMLHEGGA